MSADRNLYWHGPLIGWAVLLILSALTALALWWLSIRDIPDEESTLDEKQ